MNLILIVLMVYGFCNIIAFSDITTTTRIFFSKHVPFLFKLMTCMMCLSFWCGVTIALLMTHIPIFFTNYLVNVIAFGFFTSGCVWLIHTFQECLERVGK